jgi:phosphoglycerate dehydrogenase-like enzyme
MTRKALITAEFDTQAVARLEEMGYSVELAGWGQTRRALTQSDLSHLAQDVSLLVVEVEQVTREVITACSSLEIIATCRSGPSNVDVAAATEAGISVLCTPGRNADAVADFVIGLILILARNIWQADRHLRKHGWHVGEDIPYFHFRGPELSYATLGLVGCGAIGRLVARRARCLGMDVLGYDPFLCQDDVGEIVGLCELAEVFAEADFLSLHVPLNEGTRSMIGAPELARMKPSSYLINTARAAVIDEQALFSLLQERRVAGAALDVFWEEPLPHDSPWLGLDNVLLTPHIAGAADHVKVHHAAMVVEDVRTLLTGGRPARQVNIPRVAQGSA